MAKRIGIYAGTFDPVHAGHITFALQAMRAGKLDRVYFMPERKPRYKVGVEHFGHRVAMLKRALQPHPKFGIIEITDISFTMRRTLPQLQQRFAGAQLVFLFGSDAASTLPQWQHIEQSIDEMELIVGVRGPDQVASVKKAIDGWAHHPKTAVVLESYAPEVSSRSVREALYRRQPVRGLLASVRRYSDRHWLYVTIA
jgi:nicotinate-nucleotide adenylyltransferase